MTNTAQAEQVNTIEDALSRLGVNANTLSPGEKHALDEQGYMVLPDAIDKVWLGQLRAAFDRVSSRQPQAVASKNSGTVHLKDLVNEGDVFRGAYAHPKLLAAAYHVLGRSFSIFQFHGRNPLPGYGQQGLHTDWRPRAAHEPFNVVTAIWLLDDYTPVNGATRLVPGTHRLIGQVPKSMADPSSRHPNQLVVLARAGSALIFNGHLWHSGTRNSGEAPRRVLQCQIVAREYSGLAQDKHNDPGALDPAIRYILGA
jgi:ectoine hydroxylase-related dioxygenase (phytanoyl-CoA dioxygenase family)